MNRLLIALISHKPLIDFRVMESIEAAIPSLGQIGWQASRLCSIGNADLAGARNTLFAEAYHQGFDKMLFVDADVSWEIGTVERLVLHPVDLVCGVYRFKNETGQFTGSTFPGPIRFVNPEDDTDQPFGLCEVNGGPTGLMCISRKCMERMIEAYSERWYDEPKTSKGKAWNVFEFATVNHKRMTEDFNFCRLWREIGGKVWCDPHLTLHHHGDKSYSGCFADHLREVGRVKVNDATLAG